MTATDNSADDRFFDTMTQRMTATDNSADDRLINTTDQRMAALLQMALSG